MTITTYTIDRLQWTKDKIINATPSVFGEAKHLLPGTAYKLLEVLSGLDYRNLKKEKDEYIWCVKEIELAEMLHISKVNLHKKIEQTCYAVKNIDVTLDSMIRSKGKSPMFHLVNAVEHVDDSITSFISPKGAIMFSTAKTEVLQKSREKIDSIQEAFDKLFRSYSPDVLKIEGIYSKGFGFLPKYTMVDTHLSIGAKAIYAYFCSFSGNGANAIPSLKEILCNLGISEERYYGYLKELTLSDYIRVEQTKLVPKLSSSTYTLTQNPKNIKIFSEKKNGTDLDGYGIIPRAVMVDSRLDIKAKGIYAYFCCLVGGETCSFPKRSDIFFLLGIGESTYYKYYKTLVQLNFITVNQRHVNRKLSIND